MQLCKVPGSLAGLWDLGITLVHHVGPFRCTMFFDFVKSESEEEWVDRVPEIFPPAWPEVNIYMTRFLFLIRMIIQLFHRVAIHCSAAMGTNVNTSVLFGITCYVQQ